MSFGSQPAGDPVIPKFDMHIYTFVLTIDEVNSLVKEYAIPLDLHPCIPPSTLTMNNLPGDKMALSRTYLPISSARLEPVNHVRDILSYSKHKSHRQPIPRFLQAQQAGSLVLLRTSYEKRRPRQDFQRILHKLESLEGRFFLIDRRAIPDAMALRHKNSSVADPPPTGVRAEDIRPVYLTMLYEIGLMTIWKHVGVPSDS
ncbi:hypothetical protein Tco_1009085 [Tanacetum coccineum]